MCFFFVTFRVAQILTWDDSDIHHNATLTKIYFENTFCLVPFASTSKLTSTSPDTSDIGVKVALGDSGKPTHCLIVDVLPCS